MAAARPAAFDVWFVAVDTVYRGVPAGTVADWAGQGRVGADDKVRPVAAPGGPVAGWVRAADHPAVRDFLFRGGRPSDAPTAAGTEPLRPVEMDVQFRKRTEDEDDDVDMIPLIDISLVLLIFFMMTAAVSALSPVDVPDMRYASELGKEADAFTVHVDKKGKDDVFFALRVGEAPPAPDDNNLASLPELLARLDAKLGTVQRPPEVRIACNKELPRRYVRDLTRELDKRKKAGKVAIYGAEVNETKQ